MGPPHPDRVPSVRVAVLGDAGVGKTSLAQLLAEGAQPAEAPLPTQGCDVFVRLVQVPDPGGGAFAAGAFWQRRTREHGAEAFF